MVDDATKPTPEPSRLPTPSEIIDAVAKGRAAAQALSQALTREPEHLDDGRLGDLSPPHSPSRGR